MHLNYLTLCCCLLLPLALSANHEAQNADTLYVWAQSGLRVRDTPTPDGEILEKLSFGSIVHILEKVDSNSVPYEVIAETTMKEWEDKPVKKGVYKLKGHWVRVGYGKKTGYVFDQYLSRLKPVTEKDMKRNEQKFYVDVSRLTFLSLNFGEKFKTSVVENKKYGGTICVYTFGHGAKHESQAHEGGGWTSITLPKGYTLREGYLLGAFFMGGFTEVGLYSSMPSRLTFQNENSAVDISIKSGVVTIMFSGWC